MKFLQSITGHHRPLLRALGRRYFAAPTEEYAKRNYANNESEYSHVIESLTSQRRYFLLRDVYEDMLLDGVKPERDTFRKMIVGTMKGARLQDAFFFREEMKAMGLVPDVVLYNFLISVCGKCKNYQQATRIFEEMKIYEVKPTGQTYICLLNACAAAGQLDRVKAIVRDMTAAGLGLNKFCYAGLISAHRNKTPITEDTAATIVGLVAQSKGWSSVEASRDNAENIMMRIFEEELYNLPTAEYVRRGVFFLNRQFTVYHAAFHACADFRNVEAIEALLEMLRNDGKSPDVYLLMQLMRCYLHSGDIEHGQKIFEEYMKPENPPVAELFVTLVEGAMVGYTPHGMQLALETLENMTSRNLFLSPRQGNDLLLLAAGEKTGGYTLSNYIWDLMQSRNIVPSLPAVEAYYKGLKERDIPEDDQRLMLVSRTYDNLCMRFGGQRGPGRP